MGLTGSTSSVVLAYLGPAIILLKLMSTAPELDSKVRARELVFTHMLHQGMRPACHRSCESLVAAVCSLDQAVHAACTVSPAPSLLRHPPVSCSREMCESSGHGGSEGPSFSLSLAS